MQKNGILFCIEDAKVEAKKNKKTHIHYEPDFKEEILRMLNSIKNVDEISKIFGIGRNVVYAWKSKSQIKTKTKTSDEQTTYILKIISENYQLKKREYQIAV